MRRHAILTPRAQTTRSTRGAIYHREGTALGRPGGRGAGGREVLGRHVRATGWVRTRSAILACDLPVIPERVETGEGEKRDVMLEARQRNRLSDGADRIADNQRRASMRT